PTVRFRGVRVVCGRVLTRLQQIRTVARAVERHLALLAAALRTDFPMHGRAKPLFFAFLTDSATQVQFLAFDYFMERARFYRARSLENRAASFELRAIRFWVARSPRP